MTSEEYVKKVDRRLAEEVYAKLVALQMEFEVDKNMHFNSDILELSYHIALDEVKKFKFTKLQLCALAVKQSDNLMKLGFTKDHLLNLVALDL